MFRDDQSYTQFCGLNTVMKCFHKETEVMCVNVPFPTEIRVRGQGIPYTDKCALLGWRHCVDIQSGLNKARNAFTSLTDQCGGQQATSTKTKLRIYQSCVLSTLLYGSECW